MKFIKNLEGIVISKNMYIVILPSTWFKSGAQYMRQKYMLINLNGVNSMLLTKNIIKFNNFFVKIPKETNRVWDASENRWGYTFSKK